MGQCKEVWGSVGGSPVPGEGLSCSSSSSLQAVRECGTGWEPLGDARHSAQGLGSRVADGWGAGDRGAGEEQGHLSAQTTVASLFRVIYNWAKNGDVATAVSLLSPGHCGQFRADQEADRVPAAPVKGQPALAPYRGTHRAVLNPLTGWGDCQSQG